MAMAPPEPPSPMMTATLGTPNSQASFGRARDCLGLPAFLRADARIGARGIDQRQHRNTEMIRHVHEPGGLAVTFRSRHAEIVLETAVGVGALFLADDADALTAEAAEAADDGGVVAEAAVAGERDEIADELTDIVEAVRPLRMPRHLRLLPRRQARIELLERLAGLDLDTVDFLADGDGIAASLQRAHFFHFGLELGHRLFEIEIGAHHANVSTSRIHRRGAHRTLAGRRRPLPRIAMPILQSPCKRRSSSSTTASKGGRLSCTVSQTALSTISS